MYGETPPLTDKSALPVQEPKQLILAGTTEEVIADGSEIVTHATLAHPLISVTVTQFEPAHNPVAVAVVSPFPQEYVKGDVPPAMDAVACPLHNPAPVALLPTVADAVPAGLLFTVIEFVAIQPFASVTVTV